MMSAQESTTAANIEVVARIRPLSDIELVKGQQSAVRADADIGSIEVRGSACYNKVRTFNFHRVFDTEVTQQTVFESCILPLIDDVLLGFNVCILAYGQTGSGKTYTMEGAPEEKERRSYPGADPQLHSTTVRGDDRRQSDLSAPRMFQWNDKPSKQCNIPESAINTRRSVIGMPTPCRNRYSSCRRRGGAELAGDQITDAKSVSLVDKQKQKDIGICNVQSECTSQISDRTFSRKEFSERASGRSKGIVQRSVRAIFEHLEQRHSDKFEVTCSHLELYNEEMYDLMSSVDGFSTNSKVGRRAECIGSDPTVTGHSQLRLEEGTNGHVRCVGLSEHRVLNDTAAINLIQQSSRARTTKSTWSNDRSSRSHSIVQLNVVVRESADENGVAVERVGQLSLVDLAGSECIKRCGTHGSTARESATINQSLLTLGRVITALVTKLPHVPYRDSKLTRLLRDSLGGNSKTLIVATISPSILNCEETLSTLQYAVQAACIVNAPRRTERISPGEQMKRLVEENQRLLDLLKAQQERNGNVLLDNNSNQNEAVTPQHKSVELGGLQATRRQDALTRNVATQSDTTLQVRAKHLEDITLLKVHVAKCEKELAEARDSETRQRDAMLKIFGDVLDEDPPSSGSSTAFEICRKLRAQVEAGKKEAAHLRERLSSIEAAQAVALKQVPKEEEDDCKHHCITSAVHYTELQEIKSYYMTELEEQSEKQALERTKLNAQISLMEQKGHASKTRLAQLRVLDAKLWNEMSGEFGPLQGPSGIRLQSVEGQASCPFEADKLCRWAETQESGNLFDSLHDDFCTLLWSEDCSADAAAGPAIDCGPSLHSGIAAVALATRLLRAQLYERSDEATRLRSELAGVKVTTAAQLAGLRHELQEVQDAFEVERAEINAQLERAWGDRKDLVRQTELLHANMSVHIQNAEQAACREKLAVDAMTATEQSLTKLRSQRISERRASQKLKHAVSVAAAEFSRRLVTNVQDDDANG